MRTRLAVSAAALVLLIALAVARGAMLARMGIEAIGSLALGGSLRIASVERVGNAFDLHDLRLTRDGKLVVQIADLQVGFRFRDLLPGSRHRFGIRSLELRGAKFSLIRLPDGSFALPNLPLAGPSYPQPANRVPLALQVRVRDASLRFADTLGDAVRVGGIDAVGAFDSAGRSTLRASGRILGPGGSPFALNGGADAGLHLARYRLVARSLPLVAALRVLLGPASSVRLRAGSARDLRATLYEIGARGRYHLDLQAQLRGGSLQVPGLAVPIDRLAGPVALRAGGLYIGQLAGELAGIPVAATGSIFNWGAPQLQIAASGRGRTEALAKALPWLRGQPLHGALDFGALAEGPVWSPLLRLRLRAARMRYGAYVGEKLAARAIYADGRLAIAAAHASYGHARLSLHGIIRTGGLVRSDLLVHGSGDAADLPLVGELLGREPLRLDLVLRGRGGAFGAWGSLLARNAARRAGALIALDSSGAGSIAPVWLRRGAASLAGAYVRPSRGAGALWLRARSLDLQLPVLPAPPGAPLLPPFSGRLERLDLLGGGAGHVLVGSVAARGLTLAGVPFTRLTLSASGALPEIALRELRANGSWGSFTGRGALEPTRVVVAGSARIEPGRLPFPSGLALQGSLSGPISLALAPDSLELGSAGMRGTALLVDGVPVSRLAGSVAYNGSELAVHGLAAEFAGGRAFGSGTLALGPGSDALSVVASQIAAGAFRRFGLPLESGRIGAHGQLAFDGKALSYTGGVVLSGARSGRFTIGAVGDVRYGHGELQVSQATGELSGAVGSIAGSLRGLGGSDPRIAARGSIAAAPIAPMLDAFAIAHPPVGGVVAGAFTLGGSFKAPQAEADLTGLGLHLNGQGIRRASGSVALSTRRVSLLRGRLLVGSTAAHAEAAYGDAGARIALSARNADLEDFDDLFDTGDTLAGRGSIAFDLRSDAHALSSQGRFQVLGLRIRNLTLGAATGHWTSTHNVVTGIASDAGPYGALAATGSVTARPGPNWRSSLLRARYDLHATLSGLDLATWIAVLDLPRIPATGQVDATLALQGSYPHARAQGSAALRDGTLFGVPIDKLTLAGRSDGSNVDLLGIDLATPGLDARASGHFGFAPDAPIALRGSASSTDIAGIISRLAHLSIPVTGRFESTFAVAGTERHLQLRAGFDGRAVTLDGVQVSSLFGAFAYANGRLDLQNAGARFTRGRVDLSGELPIRLRPLGIGPGSAPVDASLTVSDLDPGIAARFLGNTSELAGQIDGVGQLAGRLDDPTLAGRFTVRNGSYRSDLERIPLTGITGTLLFGRKHAQLLGLSAFAGPGRLLGSGTLRIGAGGALSYRAQMQAVGATLASPVFGGGTLDADLTLAGQSGSLAKVSGKATLRDGVLPFMAFAGASALGTGHLPFDLAFDVGIALGPGVRVRGSGYGAGLDIGATGSAQLAGTLRSPTLQGRFISTGGSLVYFDRSFRVDDATLRFQARNGVMPTLAATASAQVSNPDPNRARNPFGSAKVSIVVRGPLDALDVHLTSDPSYPREQILALIAPFGGVVGSAQSFGVSSGAPSVGEEAFNLLNAQFSSALLGPIESALGRGLGLSDLSLNLSYTGGVAVTAQRILGKKFSVAYSTSFGTITRQSVSLQFVPTRRTVASLTFFTVIGSPQLLNTTFGTGTNLLYYGSALPAGVALNGTNGFSFTLELRP